MATTSHLTNHIRYVLGEEPLPVTANPATTLRQAERAQRWLLEVYLVEWLKVVAALKLPDSDWIERIASNALTRLGGGIATDGTKTELVFFLGGLQSHLRLFLSHLNGAPRGRSLDWGIMGRDVPMAIVDGYREAGGLDPVVCEGVSQCTMLCAFLVSQVLDEGALAEQISETMFEAKTLELLRVLDEVTPSPEA